MILDSNMTAMVSPQRIAQVMGLRRKVHSLAELSAAVRAGLPKSALQSSVARVFPEGLERTAMLYRIIPEATYKRRRDHLKADESERTERLARVIATAEYVWDDKAEARRFLTTPHAQLESQSPIEVALSELGARRVEELLWKLYYGLAA
jgi:putative toxin-antitoxin system antitoxin component (TIGR02293 family)